jgi:hypothetical protein
MNWIVIGEKGGKVLLVSKSTEKPGLLPKGSYLTVEDANNKFILRVEDSVQLSSYNPSPMIVEMDLSPLLQDQKCQNVIEATRVKDLTNRSDGLIDFIRPQLIARRSTQEEINQAFENIKDGPKVFLATVHGSQDNLITDEKGTLMATSLPIDMFYHQMLVCGKTGSGKTVGTKYLAQYFVEELGGAVLAINVKDIDFLKMNIPSTTRNESVIKEWKTLKKTPHGIDNFVVYYPANTQISGTKGITAICQKVTLDVHKIDPESLNGLLHGITDIAAQNLPNIFRYWQKNKMSAKDKLSDFVDYLNRGIDNKLRFSTLTVRGDESEITLAKGTFDNIQRNLNSALDFFDNEDAQVLDEMDILSRGKMSVIDVAGENGIQFGSVLLRHLLSKIVNAKSDQKSKVPILIIIDEVHRFYDSDSTEATLGALDTISRTGRSQEIAVIFSSQNPSDIPRGLSNVINTKIFFKAESEIASKYGVKATAEEMDSLKSGYAAASIYGLPQLKFLKFPLSFGGVFN